MDVAQTEKKGVDLLKKIIEVVVKDIKLGAEIAKGGIGPEDIAQIPHVIDSIKEILDLVSEKDEVIAEAKDIDASEVGVLLISAWTASQAKA